SGASCRPSPPRSPAPSSGLRSRFLSWLVSSFSGGTLVPALGQLDQLARENSFAAKLVQRTGIGRRLLPQDRLQRFERDRALPRGQKRAPDLLRVRVGKPVSRLRHSPSLCA